MSLFPSPSKSTDPRVAPRRACSGETLQPLPPLPLPIRRRSSLSLLPKDAAGQSCVADGGGGISFLSVTGSGRGIFLLAWWDLRMEFRCGPRRCGSFEGSVQLSPSSPHGAGGGINASWDLQPAVGIRRAVMWEPTDLPNKGCGLSVLLVPRWFLFDAWPCWSSRLRVLEGSIRDLLERLMPVNCWIEWDSVVCTPISGHATSRWSDVKLCCLLSSWDMSVLWFPWQRQW
jgi:hypothetical protein